MIFSENNGIVYGCFRTKQNLDKQHITCKNRNVDCFTVQKEIFILIELKRRNIINKNRAKEVNQSMKLASTLSSFQQLPRLLEQTPFKKTLVFLIAILGLLYSCNHTSIKKLSEKEISDGVKTILTKREEKAIFEVGKRLMIPDEVVNSVYNDAGIYNLIEKKKKDSTASILWYKAFANKVGHYTVINNIIMGTANIVGDKKQEIFLSFSLVDPQNSCFIIYNGSDNRPLLILRNFKVYKIQLCDINNDDLEEIFLWGRLQNSKSSSAFSKQFYVFKFNQKKKAELIFEMTYERVWKPGISKSNIAIKKQNGTTYIYISPIKVENIIDYSWIKGTDSAEKTTIYVYKEGVFRRIADAEL